MFKLFQFWIWPCAGLKNISQSTRIGTPQPHHPKISDRFSMKFSLERKSEFFHLFAGRPFHHFFPVFDFSFISFLWGGPEKGRSGWSSKDFPPLTTCDASLAVNIFICGVFLFGWFFIYQGKLFLWCGVFTWLWCFFVLLVREFLGSWL